MRKYCTIIGLLLVVVLPVCAQNWTPQDSLRLRRLLDGEGQEVDLTKEDNEPSNVAPKPVMEEAAPVKEEATEVTNDEEDLPEPAFDEEETDPAFEEDQEEKEA